MDMYMRLYEEQKRRADDKPTIGLSLSAVFGILCYRVRNRRQFSGQKNA